VPYHSQEVFPPNLAKRGAYLGTIRPLPSLTQLSQSNNMGVLFFGPRTKWSLFFVCDLFWREGRDRLVPWVRVRIKVNEGPNGPSLLAGSLLTQSRLIGYGGQEHRANIIWQVMGGRGGGVGKRLGAPSPHAKLPYSRWKKWSHCIACELAQKDGQLPPRCNDTGLELRSTQLHTTTSNHYTKRHSPKVTEKM
jgi:hypothetical protein